MLEVVTLIRVSYKSEVKILITANITVLLMLVIPIKIINHFILSIKIVKNIIPEVNMEKHKEYFLPDHLYLIRHPYKKYPGNSNKSIINITNRLSLSSF